MWYLMEHLYEFDSELALNKNKNTFDCLIDDKNIFFQINVVNNKK